MEIENFRDFGCRFESNAGPDRRIRVSPDRTRERNLGPELLSGAVNQVATSPPCTALTGPSSELAPGRPTGSTIPADDLLLAFLTLEPHC